MSMDTPSGESGALDTNQAAALFADILSPREEQQTQAEEKPAVETPKETPEATQAEAEAEKVEEAPAESDKVTIEVDGKTVELTKAELADYYKNGLRQADYTKKTMEVSEQRKAAEAEAAKVREERQQLAQKLTQAQTVLQAQLQEQSQIDWHGLRETDPQEFLKQWHLYTERQAKLQSNIAEQQQLYQKHQAEQAETVSKYITEQQQELLAKLPEWKDETKAKADRAQIRDYLKSQGFEDAQINQIADHRFVLMAREAMLYRKTMESAKAAAKKVNTLPGKVERPGGGEANALDGRTSAMRQLAKSGKVEDAARVFASIL